MNPYAKPKAKAKAWAIPKTKHWTKKETKTWTKHKPKARGTAKVLRTNAEAWALSLENKALVYRQLYKYVNAKSLNWYRGDDLRIELESYAWEGMLEACRRWDPALGKLSTYAVPTINNYLVRGMNILAKMGGNVKSGGSIKGAHAKMETPWVDSLEQWQETQAEQQDGQGGRGLAETMPQPWQDPDNTFEDDIVGDIGDSQVTQRIKEIVDQMPEPHRTAFQLMHFTEPTHDKKPHALGSGLTLKEISEIMGRDTTIVRKWLLEAEEYIRHQLDTGEV
jgi:RNA polymerase sigma factor (sigma-70 family)